MPRAVITLETPDAHILRDALGPEAGREIPKTRVTIRGSPRRLTLILEAEDQSALRAAVNSYLRWADVAVRMREEVIP